MICSNIYIPIAMIIFWEKNQSFDSNDTGHVFLCANNKSDSRVF